jgi:hypothetical protein
MYLTFCLSILCRYPFWDAETDDDAAFERRLDSVVREIGDRGKVLSMVSEAVPPPPVAASRAPGMSAAGQASASAATSAAAAAPAPAPALAPAPAPAPAPSTPPRSVALAPAGTAAAGAAAAEQAFSPSMQTTTMPPMQGQGMAAVDTSAMVERLLDQQREMMREQRDYQERKMTELEAKLEAKDRTIKAKIAELTAPAPSAISEEQLTALQARLEGLHVAKLLSDEVRSKLSSQHRIEAHTLSAPRSC